MSQRVWIAQCLCPGRHCIMASAGEADGRRAAEVDILAPVKTAIAYALAHELVNPWCAMCNAKADTWQFELGRTSFVTLEAARPVLEWLQAEQLISNAMFGDMPTEKPN